MKSAGINVLNGEKTPIVGFQDGEKIHLGHNVWISMESYSLVVGTATSPYMFVAEMMIVVFSYQILLNSTLTGKPSNRTKITSQKPQKKLDSIKVMAIKEIFRYWLINERKMNITEADDEVDKTKEYIRKKISALKDPRPSKRVNQSLSREDEAEELERHLEKINMLIDEGDRMEDECRSMTDLTPSKRLKSNAIDNADDEETGQLIGDYNTVNFKPVEDNLSEVEDIGNIEKEKNIELEEILVMEY